MLDGNSSIHTSHRLYYAYLSRSSAGSSGGVGGAGSGSGAVSGASTSISSGGDGAGYSTEIEHSFGRPMVLAKLGQYIMDVKVCRYRHMFFWYGCA